MNGNDLWSELTCAGNLSFLLSDDKLYSSQAHKVQCNSKIECLIPCSNMKLNGKTQLYFLNSSFTSLFLYAKECSCKQFMDFVSNLTDSINQLKNNGFIDVSNVLISSKHIFIDMESNSVKLICLPIVSQKYINNHSLEGEIACLLKEIIENNKNLGELMDTTFFQKLVDGSFLFGSDISYTKKEEHGCRHSLSTVSHRC